jgi:hypothetical protein
MPPRARLAARRARTTAARAARVSAPFLLLSFPELIPKLAAPAAAPAPAPAAAAAATAALDILPFHIQQEPRLTLLAHPPRLPTR